jgi:hypothetical protein
VDATRLTEYLKRKMPQASDLRVIDLMRIPGGSSRETYSFDLEWTENEARETRPMIRGAIRPADYSSQNAHASTESSTRCIARG